MRWYCVLCFAASRLKKSSTLRLLSASVTFTPSSRKARSSGGGRKSGTTLSSPRSSSVYLIFALLDAALSPIAGSKYTNDAGAISEADRHDRPADLAKAEEPCSRFAVLQVFRYCAAGIRERQPGLSKADTVL